MVEAAVRGMLAVPPLYTSASDAHAKLGGPLDQKHQKRKTNWLRAVNKLYRMRIFISWRLRRAARECTRAWIDQTL